MITEARSVGRTTAWLVSCGVPSVAHSGCPAGMFHVSSADTAMDIRITPPARQRMQDFLRRNPDAAGVRFGVKRTGCSGFGYVVDLASEQHEGDACFEIDGIPVLVDAKSQPMVDGIVIDYQRQGLSAGFVFHNPNATGECGCGESFTVG